MGLVRTLIDCEKKYTQPTLPQEMRDLYGGDLHLPTSPAAARPCVIANVVSTLDGVVSYEIKECWRLNHQWF